MARADDDVDQERVGHPRWVVHPGEILAETLQDHQMTQAYLASITGFTPKHINQVIKGKAHLGPQFALALETAFGVSAEFWMNLQTACDLGVARGYGPL